MPGGDGTGPAGMGPMTGRAAGYCAGYSVPGYMNPYGGRFGGGLAWGRGRGWGFPYRAPLWDAGYAPYPFSYSKEQERDMLKNQVKALEDQIAAVRKRMEELEEEPSEESG